MIEYAMAHRCPQALHQGVLRIGVMVQNLIWVIFFCDGQIHTVIGSNQKALKPMIPQAWR